MSARELAEWHAFDSLEPIGASRLDALHAIACQLAARAAGAKNVKPEDFVPWWKAERKPLDIKKAVAFFTAMTRAVEGTVVEAKHA